MKNQWVSGRADDVSMRQAQNWMITNVWIVKEVKTPGWKGKIGKLSVISTKAVVKHNNCRGFYSFICYLLYILSRSSQSPAAFFIGKLWKMSGAGLCSTALEGVCLEWDAIHYVPADISLRALKCSYSPVITTSLWSCSAGVLTGWCFPVSWSSKRSTWNCGDKTLIFSVGKYQTWRRLPLGGDPRQRKVTAPLCLSFVRGLCLPDSCTAFCAMFSTSCCWHKFPSVCDVGPG